MTKNQACCGFQGGLQTKNGELPTVSSYIMW